MTERSAGLAGLLAAAEGRMPVESAEVIAFELARRLEARCVSFLITDFTGNAVVRLSNADAGEERERIKLPGTVYGQVLREQRVSVRRGGLPDGQFQIVAPVTNRGMPSGFLKSSSHMPPNLQLCRRSSNRPMPWPTSSSPTAASPTCTSGAAEPSP